MTTLAYRNGVLACDSQMTNNGTVVGNAFKIRKRGSLLIAGCGTWAIVTRFMDWVVAGCKGDAPPMHIAETENSAGGFIFLPDGTIVVFEASGTCLQICDYFAEGSGRDTALGALAVGASAEEAIRAAIQHDIYSGGEIQVLRHD